MEISQFARPVIKRVRSIGKPGQPKGKLRQKKKTVLQIHEKPVIHPMTIPKGLSKQEPQKKFESLMHLFNCESLLECFHALNKNKAVGIDGVNKMDYGINLNENIEALITKMKSMAYRPGPVREVLIPIKQN